MVKLTREQTAIVRRRILEEVQQIQAYVLDSEYQRSTRWN